MFISLGPLGGILALFVYYLNVDALFNKELGHLGLSVLTAVEKWCLSIIVDNIMISTVVHQKLHSIDVTFSYSVEQRGLSVGVQTVSGAACV